MAYTTSTQDTPYIRSSRQLHLASTYINDRRPEQPPRLYTDSVHTYHTPGTAMQNTRQSHTPRTHFVSIHH
eukprot:6648018-Pyramimonas_sp.AAC.1